jgi:hypothetical protein
MEHTQLFRSVIEVRQESLYHGRTSLALKTCTLNYLYHILTIGKLVFGFFEQVNRISTNIRNTQRLLAQQHYDCHRF